MDSESLHEIPLEELRSLEEGTESVRAATPRHSEEVAKEAHEVVQKQFQRTQFYPSFGESAGTRQTPWESVASKITVCLKQARIFLSQCDPFIIFAFHHRRSSKSSAQPTVHEVQLKEAGLGHYHKADLVVSETADQGFEWKRTLINSAQTSIELSANYAGGQEFQDILDCIEKRLKNKPQLTAHVLVNPDFLEPQDKERLERLKAAYKGRFEYLINEAKFHFEGGAHTEENHVKVLVIDEKYFVTGGTSITPRLSHENTKGRKDIEAQKGILARLLDRSSRDNDIVGRSEEVAQVMRREFYKLFQICEGKVRDRPVESRYTSFPGEKESKGTCPSFDQCPELIQGVKMKVFVGGPEHSLDNPITNQYVKRIKKAKASIMVANMQFDPHKSIAEALAERKKGGAHITVLTGGTGFRGSAIQTLTSRMNYMVANRAYEYSAPRQVFHKKVALFDRTHAVIGSYNLGRKSALYDHEMICVIKDPQERVYKRFRRILAQDQQRSRSVRPEVFTSRRWRLIGTLLRPFEGFL